MGSKRISSIIILRAFKIIKVKHLQSAFNEINKLELPTTLIANKIIIGSSLTGKAGTYTVNEEILL